MDTGHAFVLRDARRPTTAHVRVRKGVPDDADLLAHVIQSIYDEGTGFVGDEGPTGAALRRRMRSFEPGDEVLFVAERYEAPFEGVPKRPVIVGWIEARRLHPRKMRHVVTFTLAVAPWARRQGAARALIAALKTWCMRVGVLKVRLDVRGDNEAAIALYRSEGFVDEGVERGQILDRGAYVDNRIMGCFLRPELLDPSRGRPSSVR